jgi:hypothetical protein
MATIDISNDIYQYLSTELLLAVRSIEGCKDARPARGLFVT